MINENSAVLQARDLILLASIAVGLIGVFMTQLMSHIRQKNEFKHEKRMLLKQKLEDFYQYLHEYELKVRLTISSYKAQAIEILEKEVPDDLREISIRLEHREEHSKCQLLARLYFQELEKSVHSIFESEAKLMYFLIKHRKDLQSIRNITSSKKFDDFVKASESCREISIEQSKKLN